MMTSKMIWAAIVAIYLWIVLRYLGECISYIHSVFAKKENLDWLKKER